MLYKKQVKKQKMVPSLLVKISGEEEYKVWKILNKKY